VPGKTISEKILSAKSGVDARAGDVVVCEIDHALGTDAATPMAIDYFEAMDGRRVRNPERFAFSLDHYAPPSSPKSAALHDRVRAFAAKHGIHLWQVGDGIGLQLMVESGRCAPGSLVMGADSHSTMFGAMNTFGTGIGSSDLAAAMISSKVWLRVPETTRVWLTGSLPNGTYAKDIILALVGQLGQEGANYETLEFLGPGAAALDVDERLVLSNMSVEMSAKAGIFAADDHTREYLRGRTSADWTPVFPDVDARYAREVEIDLAALEPQIARPHEPDNVVPMREAVGQRVDMVFIGTCTGGRVSDFHQVLAEIESGGGIASGVTVVLTPASREVFEQLSQDGTLETLERFGAVVTTAGCGACCGTSGVIPSDGMTVVSTANRNFKARMGNATASIYLASPASCGAAAATGMLTGARLRV
jgi:3-isopropylmalate/(R)-2-methylmalate dehydratase large subunit